MEKKLIIKLYGNYVNYIMIWGTLPRYTLLPHRLTISLTVITAAGMRDIGDVLYSRLCRLIKPADRMLNMG